MSGPLQGVPTSLDSVLTAIEAQLVATLAWDPSLVFVSLSRAEIMAKYPPDQQFITIRPERFPVDADLFTGGAPDTLVFNGSLTIYLWVQLGTDIAWQDENWLKAQNGALVTLRSIYVSLCNPPFNPQDSNGNYILEEPIRPNGFEIAERPNSQGWGRIATSWTAKWLQDLSTPQPVSLS